MSELFSFELAHCSLVKNFETITFLFLNVFYAMDLIYGTLDYVITMRFSIASPMLREMFFIQLVILIYCCLLSLVSCLLPPILSWCKLAIILVNRSPSQFFYPGVFINEQCIY